MEPARAADALPPPLRRRLRGKQATGLRMPRAAAGEALKRLLAMEDLACLVTAWLDQRSLLRLATVATACQEAAAAPEAWRGRSLELRSRQLRDSKRLLRVLDCCGARWARVREVALPQLQPSKAACRALRLALPSLRALDVQLCPYAGGQRLLAELGAHTSLEQVVLPGYLPPAPLPHLRVLELTGSDCELHQSGPAAWTRLPELAPRLETLRAPWLEEEVAADDLSEDLWEKLHQPPLGCETSDECLRQLQRLPELREVDLSGVYTVTDFGLRTLGELPKLERLVLQNAGPGVSGEGLRWLAEGSAPLQRLDLSFCKDTGRRPSSGRTALTAADVEAFRRKRPRVEVVFS